MYYYNDCKGSRVILCCTLRGNGETGDARTDTLKMTPTAKLGLNTFRICLHGYRLACGRHFSTYGCTKPVCESSPRHRTNSWYGLVSSSSCSVERYNDDADLLLATKMARGYHVVDRGGRTLFQGPVEYTSIVHIHPFVTIQ